MVGTPVFQTKKKKIYVLYIQPIPLSSSPEVPQKIEPLASSTKLLPEGYFGQSFVRFTKVPGSWFETILCLFLIVFSSHVKCRGPRPACPCRSFNVGPSEIARKPFSAVLLLLLFPRMLPFLSLSVQWFRLGGVLGRPLCVSLSLSRRLNVGYRWRLGASRRPRVSGHVQNESVNPIVGWLLRQQFEEHQG